MLYRLPGLFDKKKKKKNKVFYNLYYVKLQNIS
jgi:hypothetical protein